MIKLSDWGCNSVVEHLPHICEVLGSTPSTEKNYEIAKMMGWKWLKQCPLCKHEILSPNPNLVPPNTKNIAKILAFSFIWYRKFKETFLKYLQIRIL
jgi:hypothetical protein